VYDLDSSRQPKLQKVHRWQIGRPDPHFPDAFGLTAAEAAALVVEVIAVIDTWKTHFETLGVTTGDITQLTEWIDGDTLLAQRRGFDAGRYQQAPARRKRESPFRRR
jgi:serine/threonine-protein kinase HipA